MLLFIIRTLRTGGNRTCRGVEQRGVPADMVNGFVNKTY